ncbi:MAG: sulfurtransferase [Thermoplasmataceae archaeon]
MLGYRDIFVTPGWLSSNLQRENLVIIDCRYDLGNPAKAKERYESGHIPGSFRLDMEEDLAGRRSVHGGRHPLPDFDVLASRLRKFGISSDTIIICYDDDLSGSSRLWFLMNCMGHSNTKILDGGIAGWVEEGHPLSTVPGLSKKNGTFHPASGEFLSRISGMDEIRRNIDSLQIIDSRARPRYLGEYEPIDSRAGHIPGAINIEYTRIQEKPGKIRRQDELEMIYSGIGREPVVYCGSGVTSCVNFVGLTMTGRSPRLYAGSWSDWISYRSNPVAAGEE